MAQYRRKVTQGPYTVHFTSCYWKVSFPPSLFFIGLSQYPKIQESAASWKVDSFWKLQGFLECSNKFYPPSFVSVVVTQYCFFLDVLRKLTWRLFRPQQVIVLQIVYMRIHFVMHFGVESRDVGVLFGFFFHVLQLLHNQTCVEVVSKLTMKHLQKSGLLLLSYCSWKCMFVGFLIEYNISPPACVHCWMWKWLINVENFII